MGLDLYPLDTMAAKKSLLKGAIDDQTLVFFEHDLTMAAAYIREHDGKAVAEPVKG
jgi:hypothetical protein